MPVSNSDARKRHEESQPLIVGLSGYAQSGKDSTGKVLVEEHGFTRIAFADALKGVLYDLSPPLDIVGKSGTWITGSDFQGAVDAWGWEYVKANSKARVWLQRLGVACRDHLGPDVWVGAAFRKMDAVAPLLAPEYRRFVVTDVRFPNEYAAIKDRGGQMWRVQRDSHNPPNQHVSETALDGHTFDLTINMPDYLGDEPALREHLRRVVDNAMRYSQNPSGHALIRRCPTTGAREVWDGHGYIVVEG